MENPLWERHYDMDTRTIFLVQSKLGTLNPEVRFGPLYSKLSYLINSGFCLCVKYSNYQEMTNRKVSLVLSDLKSESYKVSYDYVCNFARTPDLAAKVKQKDLLRHRIDGYTKENLHWLSYLVPRSPYRTTVDPMVGNKKLSERISEALNY